MMKAALQGRSREWLRDARAMFSRLKQWRLSPLSAIVLAILSAIAAGTALFAAAALLWPSGWDSDAAVPDWNPPTLAVVELDPPKPASADVEALSRPIFFKNRKPAPKSAPQVDNANISDAPTGLAVTAIVKNKKVTQAFVTSSEAPEGGWHKVGDAIGSWTLHKILHAEVVFQNGDQLTRVKLYTLPPDAQGDTPGAPDANAPPAPDAPPAPGGTPNFMRSAPPD